MPNDIIAELIEVEKNARSLLDEAAAKAETRISEARAQADAMYKKTLAQSLQELQDDMRVKKQEVDKYTAAQYTKIDESLSDLPQDKEKLINFLNTHFFGA